MKYFKDRHFVKYLVFSLYSFTGCRKGELQNLKISGVNIKERVITVDGKKGVKKYAFDERLLPELEMYYEKRVGINADNDYFFITTNYNAYSLRTFNIWLKTCLKVLDLPNNISVQYIRFALNDNRKSLLEAPNSVCEVLLGHSPSNVNEKHYTGKLTNKKRVVLYDKWNPYRTTVKL